MKVKVLALVSVLLMLSAPNAMAQDFCDNDINYDGVVNPGDTNLLFENFPRSPLQNPCPPDGPAPVPKTGQTASYATGDDGDLEKLSNIGIMTASLENTSAYANWAGRGIFTNGLFYAYSKDNEGFFYGDANNDGDMDFWELYDYITGWPTLWGYFGTQAYEKEMGDSVIFTEDLWTPFASTFGGFDGKFSYVGSTEPVPEPTTMFLLSSGLFGLAAFRTRFGKR